MQPMDALFRGVQTDKKNERRAQRPKQQIKSAREPRETVYFS